MRPLDLSNAAPIEVAVGHLSREDLLARLNASGTQLNEHAKTLLADSAFDEVGEGDVVSIAERSVADIGLADGATLNQIYARRKAKDYCCVPPSLARTCGLHWHSSSPPQTRC
ncbi:hypothetical protein [Microbacterium marmarense]|uniref:Uncharacterized protein n=1 Tax=Microbacterium marmarense TaxID=3122051 RepID=A0ABU8LT39_9MICO